MLVCERFCMVGQCVFADAVLDFLGQAAMVGVLARKSWL